MDHSDHRRLLDVAAINWFNDETAGNGAEKARVQQTSGNDSLKKIVAALLLFQALSVLVPAVSSFKQLMRVELGVVGGPSESKANPSLRPG